MKFKKKVIVFILLLLVVPLFFFVLSILGGKEQKTNSEQFKENYQTFIFPILPSPIAATLQLRYPHIKIPRDRTDLTVSEKKLKVINILRVVYRNNTKRDLHNIKIKLNVTGMNIKPTLSSFSDYYQPFESSADFIITPRESVVESGKIYITEFYFYALQKGTASFQAEIESQEGYRLKTNKITMSAD